MKILILIFVLASIAQDNAQSALLDRYLAAVAKRGEYTTYSFESRETQEQAMIFLIEGSPQWVLNTITRENTTDIINTPHPNLHSTMIVTVENLDLDNQYTTYTVAAELRNVDGELYFKANYGEGTLSNLPELPEGWVMLDETSAWDGLDILELDRFSGDNDPLTNRDNLTEIVANIALETKSLDGVEVEVLIMTFKEAPDLLNINPKAEDNPFLPAILDNLISPSMATVEVYFDSSDNIIQTITKVRLVAEIDLHTIDAENFPEGASLTYDASFTSTTIYSNFNAVFTPITAPDLAEVENLH